MPKLSRYNHFHAWRDGYYLAFNARSGAVALLDSSNYSTYERLAGKIQTHATGPLTPEEEELLKQLRYGLFACDDDFSELDWLKFEHNRARFNESTLSLVIAPTMACNMACPYCYEGSKQGRMSGETMQAVIDFVKQRAGSLNGLNVDWFGGEPLLAMDIVERLSRSFIDLSETHKFEYTSTIVSNGYLLTPEIIDRLVALKCRAAQVTLDGPSRMHNRKRLLKNGKTSFDAIIRNLQSAVEKMNISIRVNVDKSFSVEVIQELVDELKQADLHKKVWVNFGMLEAATSVCSNIAEDCYGTADFSNVETEYFALLLKEGFRIQKLPAPTSVFCMAQQVGCFLIDPDGDLYRCFNHAGDKTKSAGHISAEIDFHHPEFNRLFRFDPFEDSDCRDCTILPICMGSCPARRAGRNGTPETTCDTWKYNLEPMLEIIALARQQAASAAAAAPQEKS
ncbi:hypothetical protein C3F09_08065 [candidate division GN15 bacterium]|uniref:Radical SAM core domain-containing protein n=1 Tax=candidate division GN15 bacterium TaxID=2072418 RepID=A0A855X5U2_9BACT|nr:MAG: hypothetical protein C3F09_08065 [candidate division GN15 bacterium]